MFLSNNLSWNPFFQASYNKNLHVMQLVSVVKLLVTRAKELRGSVTKDNYKKQSFAKKIECSLSRDKK